jgi:hypothetical protein
LTSPSRRSPLRNLQDLNIVSEITGRRRDRIFAYDRYLDLLNESTTPA